MKLVESWKVGGGGVLTVDGTQLTAVLAGATLGRFKNVARLTHDDTRVPLVIP